MTERRRALAWRIGLVLGIAIAVAVIVFTPYPEFL